MNSGAKMDSFEKNGDDVADFICPDNIVIGPNDMGLAQRLLKAAINSGSNSHSKFLRQIMVSADFTTSLTHWKQIDTYKVGTTTNSQSTMHKLASTPITRECFDISDLPEMDHYWDDHIEALEWLRNKYNKTGDRKYWDSLISLLPESWLQTRHWTGNYQVIRTMYRDRRTHKLKDWNADFVNWVKTLPYAKELIMYEGDNS